MTKIKDVISYLETIAPRSYQESYDNSGLLTGNSEDEVTGVLISLDCTEEVVEEAKRKNCNLIVSHHPILFKGLKKLTGENYVERTVINAIKNSVALYAIHTNLDNIVTGVNFKFAQQLGLKNLAILSPKYDTLSKLVTFAPVENANNVLDAIYKAGAGTIGNYSECSFTNDGQGSFTPNAKANPAIGKKGQAETVNEKRIEVLVPNHKVNNVVTALKSAHPYEEVAYYITALNNANQEVGAGLTGDLPEALDQQEFLKLLKESMKLEVIKFTPSYKGKIKKIALCGGAGSFLLAQAKACGAQAYISADFKYHEYFDAENQLMICDIGHYESEVATKELLHDILSKKFSNFALNLSEIVTNPISYFK
ncbi:MAG: Nif3-like dinuclear metal center hexameric protein [Cyclobacteriaceae bacterium]|nr:Nif3-like dinuclear metal center hexameric protein [Cyclobacteriaceae bacterium]